MILSEQLELFLPTYNRREHLERTLSQLTAPESPVRSCMLTILDNASSDGSSELIEDFAVRFPTIKHIRHAKNIGANANITRAFELARAPYVWVICDDDSFRWEAWEEIERALGTQRYDILLTRKNDLKGTSDIAKIIRQLSFLPAGIYRTSNISTGVLMNMQANIINMFPHLALSCEVLNKKGNIFLPQGEIMDKCTFDHTPAKICYTKGYDVVPHPFVQNMSWTVGFLNSIRMINDPALYVYILEHLGRHGFFGYIFSSFRANYTVYAGNALNKHFIADALPLKQKIKF